MIDARLPTNGDLDPLFSESPFAYNGVTKAFRPIFSGMSVIMNATVPHPDMTRRFYTPEEANRALPLVRMIVSDIVSLYQEIRDRRERLAVITERAAAHPPRDDDYSAELEQMEASIRIDIDRLQEYIQELNQLGIELQDAEVGLIEFPGLLDGLEICLSWKLGEKLVTHWHECGGSFEDRKPLESQML